jgi:hypothetical protein
MATEVQAGVVELIAHPRAPADQLLGQPREELLERLLATSQQRVDVGSLGNAAPRAVSVGLERVPVHDRHVPVVLG